MGIVARCLELRSSSSSYSVHIKSVCPMVFDISFAISILLTRHNLVWSKFTRVLSYSPVVQKVLIISKMSSKLVAILLLAIVATVLADPQYYGGRNRYNQGRRGYNSGRNNYGNYYPRGGNYYPRGGNYYPGGGYGGGQSSFSASVAASSGGGGFYGGSASAAAAASSSGGGYGGGSSAAAAAAAASG